MWTNGNILFGLPKFYLYDFVKDTIYLYDFVKDTMDNVSFVHSIT